MPRVLKLLKKYERMQFSAEANKTKKALNTKLTNSLFLLNMRFVLFTRKDENVQIKGTVCRGAERQG